MHDMRQLTLSVAGMTCEHCVRAISGSVTDVPGVRTVAVDLAGKTVTVGGEADRDAVCRAIAQAGYEVVARVG